MGSLLFEVLKAGGLKKDAPFIFGCASRLRTGFSGKTLSSFRQSFKCASLGEAGKNTTKAIAHSSVRAIIPLVCLLLQLGVIAPAHAQTLPAPQRQLSIKDIQSLVDRTLLAQETEVKLSYVQVEPSALIYVVSRGLDLHVVYSTILGPLVVSGSDRERYVVKGSIVIEDTVVNGDRTTPAPSSGDSVVFQRCVFERAVRFLNVEFEGGVTFKNCIFDQNLSFGRRKSAPPRGSVFDRDTYLEVIGVKERADFTAIVSKGIFTIDTAHFEDDVFFDDARFQRAAILSDLTFDRAASFRRTKITDTIDLSGTRYQSIRVAWATLRRKLQFDDEAYTQLIQRFNVQGQFGDADEAWYEYRTIKRDALSPSNPKYWRELLLDLTVGYGSKPSRALVTFPAVLFIFGLIFRFAPHRPRFRDALYLSCTALFNTPGEPQPPKSIVIHLRPRLHKHLHEGRRVSHIQWLEVAIGYRWVALIETVAGLVLTALLIATLVRFLRLS